MWRERFWWPPATTPRGCAPRPASRTSAAWRRCQPHPARRPAAIGSTAAATDRPTTPSGASSSAASVAPADQGLRGPQNRRGPLQEGDHPLPQALRRTRGLPRPGRRGRTRPGCLTNHRSIKSSSNTIGRVTTDGAVTEYPIPTPNSDPQGIGTGPDGALWFTESGTPGKIGRITTAGVISELPTPSPDSVPGFILTGPDHALWFTESGTPGKIGRLD